MTICEKCKHYRHAARRCRKRLVLAGPGDRCKGYQEVKIEWISLKEVLDRQ